MFPRRSLIACTAAYAAACGISWSKRALGQSSSSDHETSVSANRTNFLHACMTLPYSDFPLARALLGIQTAGFQYVAWGVSHREDNGEKVPVMPEDAPPEKARLLAKRCKDVGLQPIMMFSTVYPEEDRALSVFKQRILQAEAAGIKQLLTFGHTEGANHDLWITRFKELGPIAADHGVTIVIKQHGGNTGTGQACADIVASIDHPNVWVNYDAGNVMDYLNVDPIPDIRAVADKVRSFCIKDHRNWPTDQDCGAGFGEIDHYRLLQPVSSLGIEIPLAYENISAPMLPHPTSAEIVDANARRCREYLELVIAGLQAAAAR